MKTKRELRGAMYLEKLMTTKQPTGYKDYYLVWAEPNLLIFAYWGVAAGDDWDDSPAYCNAEPPYADQDLVYMPFYDSRNGLCQAERGSLTSSMEQALGLGRK